jgi:hypothetical protein
MRPDDGSADALPCVLPTATAARLRARLAERAGRSRAAHRSHLTVRREDVAWQVAGSGCESRALRAGRATRVDLLRLSAHSAVPWPQDVVAQELLVVAGTVVADGRPLERHGFCLRDRSFPMPLRAGDAGAVVYVRHLHAPLAALPPNEAAWWLPPAGGVHVLRPDELRWRRGDAGIELAGLRVVAGVASMLARIAPGAPVADHGHALDEDCFVLEGETFLGDLLLRSGDYQLAAAGSSHVGVVSDVGVLLYFHGAIAARQE